MPRRPSDPPPQRQFRAVGAGARRRAGEAFGGAEGALAESIAARFDKAYYDRFYRDPTTRCASVQDARVQADFLAGYLRYLEVPVHEIVDIGCGLGRLLGALGKHFRRARAAGVEGSEYLCRAYGWQRATLPDYAPPHAFDLVICQDVLAYLDAIDAAAAIGTLGRVTRKALFFGALTTEDLALCDEARTDTNVYLRPAAWYRRRLGREFEPVGGGLWLKKPVNAVIWTLDRP